MNNTPSIDSTLLEPQAEVTVQSARCAPPSLQPNPSETVQIALRGSLKGVNTIIHILHVEGFADIGDWCEPQPVPHSENGQFITLNTKRIWYRPAPPIKRLPSKVH